MSRLSYQLKALFRNLFRGRTLDRELHEELRDHLEREREANLARGSTPSGAYRAARLTVGSIDTHRESARDERPGAGVRQFMRDVGFGARLMRKSPAFSIAAVSIVTLGIAAVTAIFSVVYGVMLAPLPYGEPDRLVSIWSDLPSLNLPHALVNAADYEEWRATNHVFDDIALARPGRNFNLVGESRDGGEPERLQGAPVTTNLFRVLDVAPYLGRTFTAGDATPGHERVVILSYGLWQRRYGGDPAAVGRTISLGGDPYVVVGVMRPSFEFPDNEHQLWLPLVIDPKELTREEPAFNYRAVARLKPGVTIEQA